MPGYKSLTHTWRDYKYVVREYIGEQDKNDE